MTCAAPRIRADFSMSAATAAAGRFTMRPLPSAPARCMSLVCERCCTQIDGEGQERLSVITNEVVSRRYLSTIGTAMRNHDVRASSSVMTTDIFGRASRLSTNASSSSQVGR